MTWAVRPRGETAGVLSEGRITVDTFVMI